MDKYGLIGFPLGHSFSQRFFSKKFEKDHLVAAYSNYEISDISSLPSLINSTPELNGLNVTIPYKEDVIPYLDALDEEAQKIGAVNVIRFNRSENKLKLIGYNTDVIGFQKSIAPLINKTIHKKALILGTGGASKAVIKGLENLGLICTFVSRSVKEGMLTYQDLDKNIMDTYTVIVNSSPVGTYPNVSNSPAIPYEHLTSNHLLYDLVYNPEITEFMKLGLEQGCTVKNGKEMLEIQALAAWDIWNK